MTRSKLILSTAAGLIVGLAFVGQAPAARADAAEAAPTNELRVTVTGISKKGGHLLVQLFDNAENYEAFKALQQQKVAAQAPEMTLRFAGLKPGQYAVRMFQDVNDDGEFGRNFIGMPMEPYGFSNNPRGLTRAAHWDEAEFTVSADNHTQTIQLH